MRLAVALAFRSSGRSTRNKWRGFSTDFLTRTRVAAAAAAQRAAQRARGIDSGSGRHGGAGFDSDPAKDAAGESGHGWQLHMKSTCTCGMLYAGLYCSPICHY